MICKNPNTDNLHRVGLQAELRGMMPQAHARFGRALESADAVRSVITAP
jgi:hypothetical protein